MDLSNFSLLKEGDDHYEIGHPNGKKLTIKKAGMSEKAHAAIKKLACGGEVQNYDDGGGVAPPEPVASAAPQDVPEDTSQSPQQMMQGLQANPQIQVQGQQASDSAGGGEIPAPQAQAPADPLVQQKYDQAALLDKEAKQIQNSAGQEQKINNDAVGFLKDYSAKADAMQSPQDVVNGYKAKDDALMQSYLNDKIDPNRYYKNMSTGSRIASAIGLLFSGFGSGITGQPNIALGELNKAVDNDIDAQKNEQGKNLNLFKMNQEALGNDVQAQAATQNQLYTGVQAKLQMAALQAKNPATQLKAQQMINDIEQQKIQNRMRLGLLSQTEGGQSGQPGLLKADPAQLVPDMVPKEQQSKVFDEISKAQHVAKNQNQMLDLYDQAANQNTVLRTGAGYIRTPASILSLQALGDPLIHDQDGRVNEFEKKDYNNLLPQPGDTDAKIAEKRKGFIQFMNNKAEAPTAKGFGIDLNRFSNTNTNTFQAQPKSAQFTAWAKANPGDPRAQSWLRQNGG